MDSACCLLIDPTNTFETANKCFDTSGIALSSTPADLAACEDTGHTWISENADQYPYCSNLNPATTTQSACEDTGYTFTLGIPALPNSCSDGTTGKTQSACEDTGLKYTTS